MEGVILLFMTWPWRSNNVYCGREGNADPAFPWEESRSDTKRRACGGGEMLENAPVTLAQGLGFDKGLADE